MRATRTCPLAKTKQPASHEPRCPLGAAMFSEQAWQEIARSLRLCGQELQIVRGVFDDHTEAAIAANLRVWPHTVHTHCERLYRKLAVTDRVKLVLTRVASSTCGRMKSKFLSVYRTSAADQNGGDEHDGLFVHYFRCF